MAQFNSDVEFDLILSEVEQCCSLKNQLRKKANGIDVDAIKKQIKEQFKKELGSLVNILK